MYIENINDLINLSPSGAEEYTVAGYHTSGDGGGGTFIWQPVTPPMTSPSQDDGIIFYQNGDPSGTQGYFQRIYTGPVNVRWFGAKGDGVTDDTTAVHKARDSMFANNGGTLYFPKGVYPGEFEFYREQGELNLLGDGQGSILISNGSVNPVLRLGIKDYSDWRLSKVLQLRIDGTYNGVHKYTDGVIFYDPDDSSLAGRWDFENVLFSNCSKAIYKPKGNIGNVFNNCTWENNDFGYYAMPYTSMHSGCDRFVGGHIRGSALAGIYVIAENLYGQFTLDNIPIEGNPGFGVFIKCIGHAAMTFNSVDLRNVWFEGNGTAGNVIIDGQNYSRGQDMRFENVRSVSIYDSNIMDISAIDTSVNLYNCKCDDYYTRAPWNWPYSINVSGDSAIVARELRYFGRVSSHIFVESISYDGTSDIAGDPLVPTSVIGPLRAVNANINDLAYSQCLKFSDHWDSSSPVYFDPIYSLPRKGTYVLGDGYSQELFLPPGTLAERKLGFNFEAGKYYFWSIHTLLPLSQLLPTRAWLGNDTFVLGDIGVQHFIPEQQWLCFYGIKKCTITSDNHVSLFIENLHPYFTGKIIIADLQILAFNRFFEAVLFANSREFLNSRHRIDE